VTQGKKVLTQEIKQKIDSARDILVGKIPTPTGQVEQITLALVYKFMNDIDEQNVQLGAPYKFFTGDYQKYAWRHLLDKSLSAYERVTLYGEGLEKMHLNPNLPQFFRNVFKSAFLPFRDPDVLTIFLKQIDEFRYGHNGELGDAFEYLLQVMGTQGDAGQFLTPRHIINFIVNIVDPQKTDKILDPAVGTSGFLISAYQHILRQNTKEGSNKPGSALTPDERKRFANSFVGYDISHDMVRLSLVNMYLHDFPDPKIHEYDTLGNLDKWDDDFDCILTNPPFMTPKGGVKPHKRFSIQAKRSEVLFVDYIMEHLTPNGKAGIIVPEGIIFQSANAYKALRKMMVDQNYLYAVVSLPAGVFNPYSGVKTCILFMNKVLAKKNKYILFVKVENDGFDLGAQRRPIDKNDLPAATEILKRYKISIQTGKPFELCDEDKKTASLVPIEKISKSADYNLSGDRYKETITLVNQKWPLMELSEVCETIVDGSHNPPREASNGGFYMLSSQNIINNQINFKNAREIDKVDFEREDKRTSVQAGDVLLTIVGTVGRSAVVQNYVERFVLQRSVAVLKPLKNILNSSYLNFVLQSHFVQQNLTDSAVGVAQKGIYLNQLSLIKIPFPPIEVQREIVSQLDSYQKIIDGAKQVVDNYRPEIKIDPSWEVVELGKVCIDICNGANVNQIDQPGKYRVSRIQSISNWVFDLDKTKWTNDEPKESNFLKEGDILLSHINSIEHLAKSAIYKNIGEPVIHGINLLRLMPNKELVSPDFLYAIMISEKFISHARTFAQKAVNQASIKSSDLKLMKIPLPPQDIQKEIVARIEEEQQLVDANKKLIETYKKKIKEKIDEVWGI